MAAICAVIAFGGFAGTFWIQLPAATFVGSPLLHLHALLFSAWTLLFLYQAILVANGKLRNHQAWGLGGISLATGMLFTGMGVAVASLETRLDAGFGDAARAFAIVPVSAVLLFFGLFAAAIANVRRPEWHKRLMLVATISLLQPAIARFFFLAATGGGPGLRPGLGAPRDVEFFYGPGLLMDLLILVGIIHDWRTRGRPHAAYLWGLALVVGVQAVRVPMSQTGAWNDVADFLVGFAG
jgi:hypothetical protein